MNPSQPLLGGVEELIDQILFDADVPCQHVRPGVQRLELRNLEHRDGGNRDPREVKGEDASPVGQVARRDPAVVRFDAPSAEGEAQAQTGPIGTALFERAK